MKAKNFISAVIYVHNSENEIAEFIKMVYRQLRENFTKFEIICVNDASCDGSREAIRQVASDFSDTTVTILDMSFFQGVELAMNAGVDLTIGDFIYEFDDVTADFEETLVFGMYQKALEGYDIVSASADEREKVMSCLFYKIFNYFSFYEYQIQTESFRILSRRAVNRICSMNKTIPYRKAVYANCGLENCCVKYHARTVKGKKRGRRERKYRRNLAVDSLILFTDAGYRFTVFMTIVMMLAAVITAIYTTVIFILGNPVEGWTTTMLFLAFAFFGMFAVLAIVIKYLSILVDLVFKKQQYRFSGIEKITR